MKNRGLLSIFSLILVGLFLVGCASSDQIEVQQAQAEKVLQASNINTTSGNKVDTESLEESPTSFVIWTGAENIIVKQEGDEFKFEVDPESITNYQVRDNTNVPYDERYFYYNKWDIIFEQKDENNTEAVYSESVVITVPANTEALILRTDSGNIHAEGLSNVKLNIENGTGKTYIANSSTKYIDARSGGSIELINVTAEVDIEINYKSYLTSEFATGANGEYTIILPKETK